MKADWTSGSSGPGVVDEPQAASYVVAMPGGAPATITGVHATTDDDLEVIGTYVWTRGRADVSAAATSWPLDRFDRNAPGPEAMARPGAFRMSTRRASPFTDTVVTVVVKPRRPGLLRVKTLEVTYRRGLRRHHKTWTDVGPGICANARGTSEPTNGPCDERLD
ncbi:MAG: hypothetical protein Q7T55_13410 [Solirubrobacteraceae bacterium]|nr:hypothetical protein [Solirubrobacteraceae bacterium]